MGRDEVQAAYFTLLAAAYRRGDLSVVYPVARGTRPRIATLGALVRLLKAGADSNDEIPRERGLESVGVQPRDICKELLELLGRDEDWQRWLADHPEM